MNSYRTADGKAQIEWELKDTPKGPEFSASGQYDRGSGQCLEHIAKAYPDDEMVQRITTVWRKYHLNGMNAGTVHQKALGWGNGRNLALDADAMNDVQKDALRKRNLERVAKARQKHVEELRAKIGSNQRARQQLWNELFPGQTFTTWADETVKEVALLRPGTSFGRWRSVLAERFPDYLDNAAEAAHPAAPVASEIFVDCLGAPCPVTGKLYGHEWYYHAIPEDVLAEIRSWSSVPQPTDSLYDHNARTFLENSGVTIRITLSDSKPAPWDTAGHHYRVTLSRKESRLVFDFWGSAADAKNKKSPSEYDILACISSDSNTPTTLKEFCAEYGGDEDSFKTRQTFVRANRFAKSLRAFFSEEERTALSQIQ